MNRGKLTRSVCLCSLLVLGAFLAAQGSEQQQSAPPATASNLPTNAEVDAALSRMLGYDPNLTWHVFTIRPSPIQGLVEAIVSLNKQPPTQIYISQDGKFAIIGELIPFGPDPFAPNRAQLAAATGPTLGAAQPAIRIVEFTDLECQPCISGQALMEKISADFPNVQIVYQAFPLPAAQHPWAFKAAAYADCIARENDAAFWKFADGVFAGQADISATNADEKLNAIATSVGADPAKLATCAAAPETVANIKKSFDLGAALALNTTPTIFINGRRMAGIGNMPYEQLKNVVKFELDHAGK